MREDLDEMTIELSFVDYLSALADENDQSISNVLDNIYTEDDNV